MLLLLPLVFACPQEAGSAPSPRPIVQLTMACTAPLNRMGAGATQSSKLSPWVVELSGAIVVPEQLVAHPVLPRVLLVMPNGDVQTFATHSGETLHTWRDRSSHVVSASFAPDASYLTTVSQGGRVCIRNATDGTVQRVLLPDATPEQPFGSRTLQWSPDGKRLLVETLGAPFTMALLPL